MNTTNPAKPSHPLVSVITPCHNAAPFVADTIDSVAGQTYPAIEHIVIDDASTDASWEVISRYAGRVRVLRLDQNRGASHARNRGAELARGEFLMFLDADDLLAPDTIEALVGALHQRSGYISFCKWKRLRIVDGSWRILPAQVRPPVEGDELRGWLTGSWVPPCAVLWSRSEYQDTGGWDETLSVNDDGDLMLRALVRGIRLLGIGRGEAYYRSYSGTRLSLSGNVFSSASLHSRMRVYEKLTAELERQGRLATYLESLGIAYQRLALFGFQADPVLARECQRRGVAYAGRRALSRTWAGRLLTRVAGVERKEQIAGMLGRLGLLTRARGELRQLRQLAQSTSQELEPERREPQDICAEMPHTGNDSERPRR